MKNERMFAAARALRQLANDLGEIAKEVESAAVGRNYDQADRMCVGKKAYSTKEAAGRAAEGRGVALRIYDCPHCHQFHLTSLALADFTGVQ